MSPEHDELAHEVERLKRRLERERATRLEAEAIAERGLRELYEKQQQLELLAKIAAASNETNAIAEVMRFTLAELCQFNHWNLGHAYLATGTGETQRLVSAKVWHTVEPERTEAFQHISEETEFGPGIGLPGRVLASGKPVWVSDVGKEANFPRLVFARACGLKGATAFPVLSGDKVVAVLEFFAVAVREPNEMLLGLMGQIGMQLGRVIERQRAEESLKEHAFELTRARDGAKAAERMKSAFLATISHELRTPLNAIIGFADILNGEMFGPLGNAQYQNYAADILFSGKRLLGIINDVLDFSRLDANALDLNEVHIDLIATIESCLRPIKLQAEKAKVTVTSRLGTEAIGLLADEKRLRQILLNLMTNAVKFTPEGGEVTVSVDRSETGVAIVIADTGIGMTPGEIPRAFEPFGQVDMRLSRKYEGTGLGLPLARNLIKLHGGSLDIVSTPNAGTTVTVTFPRTRVLTEWQAQSLV